MTKWEIHDVMYIISLYGEGKIEDIPDISYTYRRIDDIKKVKNYFIRILQSEKVRACLELLTANGIMNALIYNFDKMCKMEQPKKYHIKDVFGHTVDVIEKGTTIDHKLAGLLHDIGKIYTYTCDVKNGIHFHRHQDYSFSIAKKFLKKIGYDEHRSKKIAYAVKYHMTWKDASLKNKTLIKYINRHGKENVIFFIELAIMDSKHQKSISTKHLFDYIEFVKNYKPFNNIITLPFNGNDIMSEFGLKGIMVGKVKHELYSHFENCDNVTYEMCKEFLKKHLNKMEDK